MGSRHIIHRSVREHLGVNVGTMYSYGLTFDLRDYDTLIFYNIYDPDYKLQPPLFRVPFYSGLLAHTSHVTGLITVSFLLRILHNTARQSVRTQRLKLMPRLTAGTGK